MSLLLSRRGDAALITADGRLASPGALETVIGAFDFVPIDDDVVLDLSGVHSITRPEADQLTELVRVTSPARTVVVVAGSARVHNQLSSSGLDLFVPIVQHCDDAVDLLRRKTAAVRAGDG